MGQTPHTPVVPRFPQRPCNVTRRETATPSRRPIRPRVHLHRCLDTGKVRFRDKREATKALHAAVATRHLQPKAAAGCRRREIRSYSCVRCKGWHLTSWSLPYPEPSSPTSTTFTRA